MRSLRHGHHHLHGRDQGFRLRDLAPGVAAMIVGYAPTHRSYRSKLLSMGLTRGTVIVVRNIAPFGDPIHISVRDFELSLRGDEADALILERPDEEGPFLRHGRVRRGGGWRGAQLHRRGQNDE